MARRLIVLLTVLAALTGAASAEARQLVRYEVGGGLAGRYDRLVVERDGSAHQTGDSGDHRFTVSAKRLRGLKGALKAARFTSLKRRYQPKQQVFDGITQAVRYRGKTVSVYSGADVPDRLIKVITRLRRLMKG